MKYALRIAVLGLSLVFWPTTESARAAAEPQILSVEDRTVENLAHVGDDQLEALFAQGQPIDCLPSGVAAGAARKIFNIDRGLFGSMLEWMTGPAWHQMQIVPSQQSCKIGTGANLISGSEAVKFSAQVQEDGKTIELSFQNAGGNPVYSTLMEQLGVRELMVQVPGRNGPIYVGKATYGKYDSNGHYQVNGFLAWFFLDFNAAAVEAQQCHDAGKFFDYKQQKCY